MDAVIFGGKYYFLQEPMPGTLHALWIRITGTELPTGAVVVLAASGCLVALISLLGLIRREFFPASPEWILWLASISFGLSAPQLYLVSKPTVYHEAIAFGLLFVLGGALSYAAALVHTKRSGVYFALCGLMFGLAALCRLTLILYPLCFIAALFFTSITSPHALFGRWKAGVSLALPPVAAVVILMVYNYMRFGDAFDFGRRHIMYPWYSVYEYVCLQGNAFRLAHVPENLAAYFLSLPELVWKNSLPWLRFGREIFSAGSVVMGREQLGSIGLLMPVLVLLLPFQRLVGPVDWSRPLKTILVASGLSSLVMFAMFLCYFYAVPRYLYEFTPLLFVVIFCNLSETWRRMGHAPKARRAFTIGLVLLILFNSVMGIYLGLNGMAQLE